MNNSLIQFEMPTRKSSIIKVIGVGGGGGNAVNYMNQQGIEGVDFILCNTDAKALEQSSIATRIQLGPTLTQGLGAGANPNIGEEACLESVAELQKILADNTKMAFITAGMGGGTGTGAAPVICEVAKELGILTVGIVTTPFNHEGPRRRKQAEEGIAKMKNHVDTLLIISNDKVRQQYGNVGFKNAFARADDILATAAKCIIDIINSKGTVIVDFADVCTVMRNGGVAILGNAVASGENRAQEAIEKALNSPLLNDNNIQGAGWVLININSADGEHEFTLDENEIIQEYVRKEVGRECDVILGLGTDNTLGDSISVTVIATGFNQQAIEGAYANLNQIEPKQSKVVLQLNDSDTEKKIEQDNTSANTGTTLTDATVTPAPVDLVPELKQELAPKLIQTAPKIAPISLRPPSIVKEILAQNQQAQQSAQDVQIAQTNNVSESENTPRYFELSLENTTEVNPAPQNFDKQQSAPSSSEDINGTNKQVSNNIVPSQVQATSMPNSMANQTSSLPPTPNTATRPPVMPTEDFVVTSQSAGLPDDIITVDGITFNRKRGSRYMDQDEIDEYVAFELRKLRLEQRAAQLRSVSQAFNSLSPEIHEQLEHIPAYARQGIELDNSQGSAAQPEGLYSATQIDEHGNINTKNTFMDGEKLC